jgi:hypothetical protein
MSSRCRHRPDSATARPWSWWRSTASLGRCAGAGAGQPSSAQVLVCPLRLPPVIPVNERGRPCPSRPRCSTPSRRCPTLRCSVPPRRGARMPIKAPSAIPATERGCPSVVLHANPPSPLDTEDLRAAASRCPHAHQGRLRRPSRPPSPPGSLPPWPPAPPVEAALASGAAAAMAARNCYPDD